MSLDDKLLNVGLVLVVAGPIVALILWRLWRGEVRFDGFWTTPGETRAMGQARRRDDAAEGRSRDGV